MSADRRRVLIVEDERPIRDLLRLHLELAGFDLEETGDGRAALDAARAKRFDLILLDVMLRDSTAAARSAVPGPTWTPHPSCTSPMR